MKSNKTSITRVLLSWLFVSIPLVWGVFQTIQKSLALFQ